MGQRQVKLVRFAPLIDTLRTIAKKLLPDSWYSKMKVATGISRLHHITAYQSLPAARLPR